MSSAGRSQPPDRRLVPAGTGARLLGEGCTRLPGTCHVCHMSVCIIISSFLQPPKRITVSALLPSNNEAKRILAAAVLSTSRRRPPGGGASRPSAWSLVGEGFRHQRPKCLFRREKPGLGRQELLHSLQLEHGSRGAPHSARPPARVCSLTGGPAGRWLCHSRGAHILPRRPALCGQTPASCGVVRFKRWHDTGVKRLGPGATSARSTSQPAAAGCVTLGR